MRDLSQVQKGDLVALFDATGLFTGVERVTRTTDTQISVGVARYMRKTSKMVGGRSGFWSGCPYARHITSETEIREFEQKVRDMLARRLKSLREDLGSLPMTEVRSILRFLSR
jgi:hypothetical protein